ncbi:MAG: hypothetical protein AAGF24_00245 [Cyanobacteria bacterium P01_H01_bin.121]
MTQPTSVLDGEDVVKFDNLKQTLIEVQSGKLLVVSSRRRNGLLLRKPFHTEFAGPGAAVGGGFDQDCQELVPIGSLAIFPPSSADEYLNALLIRRQWIRLLEQMTEEESPEERAQKVLTQFENYFDPRSVAKLEDDTLAELVGVLPITIRRARRRHGF